MKTLVIGGTGTVGSQVVKLLLQQHQPVRVLTSSLENAARLPETVEAVIGNLNVPETLECAFAGVDRVFMLNASSQTEEKQGQNAVAAAVRGGVRKIVYQSIHNVRKSEIIPHFQPKIAIEDAIIRSGLRYTFVSPNNFFQNDFWFKEAIVQYKVYPQPIGEVGLSRVDIRDIAEVAVKVLLSDDYLEQTIPLAGPEVLTGPKIAHILSEQLGYKVKYAGNDLEAWAAQAKLSMPAWLVEDWKLMYQLFHTEGILASEEDLNTLTQVLGKPPRSYADFVKEHASFFSGNLISV